MNFFMIGSNILDAVYDRSSVKAGLYTPGNHLKIKPADEILNDMPDYLLLLVWNFKDEIISQQQEYISRGGRFIVPLPTPQII